MQTYRLAGCLKSCRFCSHLIQCLENDFCLGIYEDKKDRLYCREFEYYKKSKTKVVKVRFDSKKHKLSK